jgi:hypothetical protein
MVANWSLCGRSRFREGVPQGALGGAKRPGVMRAIKGNIGAERAEKWNSFEKIAVKQKDGARISLDPLNAEAVDFSRRRGAEDKKMLGVPPCGEGSHLLREPVHLTASDSYNPEDEFPCN